MKEQQTNLAVRNGCARETVLNGAASIGGRLGSHRSSHHTSEDYRFSIDLHTHCDSIGGPTDQWLLLLAGRHLDH